MLGLLASTSLVFLLAAALLIQVYAVTQSDSSNLVFQHAFAQTSDQQSYTTYKNTDYGFSVEYPKGWNVIEHLSQQYAAKTVMITPDDNLQFNVGVFKDNNPYKDLTSQEVLGDVTKMMRNGCSQASFQNRGFTCAGPQFGTNVTSHNGIPIYVVAMGWTKTFSNQQVNKWVSVWGMIPTGNDVWLVIIGGSSDEFVKYSNEIAHMSNSFNISSLQNVQSQQTSISQQSQALTIPGWVKNNAKWWSEGTVSDDDFIKAIQYLVQSGIITVPSTQVSSQQTHGIPSWVKNNAKWWSEGTVSDSDFIKSIQYLVQNGMIIIQNNQQASSNTSLDYSTPPLLDLPTQQTPQLAPPEIGASKP